MKIGSRFGKGRKKKKLTAEQKKGVDVLMDMPRVAVCTLMQDLCQSRFAASLAHMIALTLTEAPQVGMMFQHLGTSFLHWGRQSLSADALEKDMTHLLWVDSDMMFPPWTLIRMLIHDEAIVASNCKTRRPPYQWIAHDEDQKIIQTTKQSSGLQRVHRIGFGLVLIKAEVFKAIEKPWFDVEWINDENIRGEDYYFFEKAKAAGFSLYIDHDLSKEVYHVGSHEFGLEDR